MTPDQLITEYRKAAIIHGEASEAGNARRCNAAYDELTRIRRQLRQAGPEHARKILTLLDDENRSVRSWAAVDALDLSPDDGVRVLREVASGPRGMVRLDAEMVLKLWDAGEWKIER